MGNEDVVLLALEPNDQYYIYVNGVFEGNSVLRKRTSICANPSSENPLDREAAVELLVGGYDLESHDHMVLLRGHAMDASGALEDSAAQCLIEFLKSCPGQFEELLNSKSKEIEGEITEEKIKRLEFMSKRNLISNLLKKKVKQLPSKSERKLLNDFILERNKYAHGVFVYLPPEMKIMIRYRASNNTNVCADVTPEHLYSFLDSYHCLNDFLSKLTTEVKSLNAEI